MSKRQKTVFVSAFALLLGVGCSPPPDNEQKYSENCTPSTLPGFCEITVSENEHVHGLLISDLNGDGQLDIFPHGHDKDDEILFAPDFTKRYDNLRTPSDRHDCDGADIDLDSDIDLFCVYGALSGEGSVGNELYLNLGDGRFESIQPGDLSDAYGRGRRSIFLDLNGDPYPDIFIANWGGREDGKPNDSAVYLNNGDTSFSQDETIDFGVIGGRCASKVRHAGEQPEGLALCKQRGHSRFYLNQNGILKDVTDSLDLNNKQALSWFALHSADINNDRMDDLILVNQLKNLTIFQNSNDPDIPFADIHHKLALEPIIRSHINDSFTVPVTGIMALADFDANMDGHPDIYMGTNILMPDSQTEYIGDFVFLGPNFEKQIWLGTRPHGTYNVKKHGENALVIVRAGPSTSGDVILLKPANTN